MTKKAKIGIGVGSVTGGLILIGGIGQLVKPEKAHKEENANQQQNNVQTARGGKITYIMNGSEYVLFKEFSQMPIYPYVNDRYEIARMVVMDDAMYVDLIYGATKPGAGADLNSITILKVENFY